MKTSPCRFLALSILALSVASLASTASAFECVINFDAKALLDQYPDRAMGSMTQGRWIQTCKFMEPADVAAVVESLGTYMELPFSDPRYDVMLWDGAGKGGCIIPASGNTPAATSSFGSTGGGSFGCDPSKAIFWNADTFPRYVSTHTPGQPTSWTQAISITTVGVVSHFDLSSFRVVHGSVDVCVLDPNATQYVKPANLKNLGPGVHTVTGIFDKFGIRFTSAGRPCTAGIFSGTPAGVDDIHIVWN
jgi:hypothetical protein